MTPKIAAYIQTEILKAVCERMVRVAPYKTPLPESVWNCADQATQIFCAFATREELNAMAEEMERRDYAQDLAAFRKGKE